MWWNFVARTPQEIADARTDWEGRRWFGEVTGYSGPLLAAPSLVKCADPNPADAKPPKNGITMVFLGGIARWIASWPWKPSSA
jgi:hypothetical protein